MESVLAGREWLAGRFSLADIFMADVLRLMDRFDGQAGYPACRKYVAHFWAEHGIGRRLCAWIDHIREASPEALAADRSERQAIDAILAVLVRLGVAEARVLEAALANL